MYVTHDYGRSWSYTIGGPYSTYSAFLIGKDRIVVYAPVAVPSTTGITRVPCISGSSHHKADRMTGSTVVVGRGQIVVVTGALRSLNPHKLS